MPQLQPSFSTHTASHSYTQLSTTPLFGFTHLLFNADSVVEHPTFPELEPPEEEPSAPASPWACEPLSNSPVLENVSITSCLSDLQTVSVLYDPIAMASP